MHYEIDLLTNSGVLVSVIIVKYLNFTPIDYIVSSIISIYIMFSAFKLGFEVSKELLDTEIKKVDLDRINSIIGKYDNLLIDYHKIRTRRSGKTNLCRYACNNVQRNVPKRCSPDSKPH